VNAHTRPAGEEADTERLTVSMKPLKGVTLIVEVPVEPALIADGATRPADIWKSATLTVTVVV
jgi:hypothetical protein